jgi:hypothetical protein
MQKLAQTSNLLAGLDGNSRQQPWRGQQTRNWTATPGDNPGAGNKPATGRQLQATTLARATNPPFWRVNRKTQAKNLAFRQKTNLESDTKSWRKLEDLLAEPQTRILQRLE